MKHSHTIILKKKITTLMALSFAVLTAFSSCKKGADAENPGSEIPSKPNTIYGTVTDAQGKPLAGVKVRAVNPTGTGIFVEGFTNAQGKYSFQITSIGGWNVYAWKNVEYKDQQFYVRLANKDEDYNPISTNGGSVKKDFIWKLTGDIPDRPKSAQNGTGYFGACMRFVNDNGALPVLTAGTKVTIKLAPVAGAKYLDGTNATQTITRSFTITGNTTNYYLTDIPGTEYRVTATCEKNGTVKAVWLGPAAYNAPQEWVEFYFDSADAIGSLEGGYLTPSEFPWYMGLKN